MSFCPECWGSCDAEEYQLEELEYDEVSYFRCPRCIRIFELVEVEDAVMIKDYVN